MTRKLIASFGQGNVMFHLLALAIVSIWGVTFISTKILLMAGLTPSDILFYRFVLAYVCICLCSRPFKLFANSVKDEFLFVAAGFFGGTLYFMTENTALEYTLVSNVALICSTTPLLTMLVQCFFIQRVRPDKRQVAGSVLAFLGVGAVIFNSRFVFNLNPVGDLLCLTSALSWTLYTLVTKYLSGTYSALFIVRKTFFYGMVTLIPVLVHHSLTFSADVLLDSEVWSRLFFLGIVASFLCFMLWNVCLRRLNTLVVSNYIYLVPVVSICTSSLILGEAVNAVLVVGAVLVVTGMYVAGKSKGIVTTKRKGKG